MLQLDYSKSPYGCESFFSPFTLLCSWFILNCLKRNYPIVDPILAEIYFQTYGINTQGLSKEAYGQLMTEYNDAILKFFLSCQRQRCLDMIENVRAKRNGKSLSETVMLAVPSQCKPFFEEMLVLNRELKTYNLFTKETQVLDSLRDTIVANSINSHYVSNIARRIDMPLNPNRSNTTGSMTYIISQGEFEAYTNILHSAVIDLYRPLFNLDRDKQVKRPIYALNETYEDSGTKFSKIVDYIKTLLFILCISYDEEMLLKHPNFFWTSCIPTSMTDVFNRIIDMAKEAIPGPLAKDITRTVASYGDLNLNHAICLPSNTTVNLSDRFVFRKSNTSITYQFLCCQEFITCVNTYLQPRECVGCVTPR